MSNIIEFNNMIAFHPGYYIKEYLDELGISQESLAKSLGTTPEYISYIIKGEQKISFEIAFELSKIMGTSIEYWLNLQSEFDSLYIESKSQQ